MATDGISINGRRIGPDAPIYCVAEMSANHNQDYDTAVKIIRAAADAGADAIKVQTYTPDTLTIDSDREEFQVSEDSQWGGRNLYSLYEEAYTPWEWQSDLQDVAQDLGLDFFSTAYDPSSVDFLEDLDVGVHKLASFELIDIPLIKKMAETGKPIIMSTGMATLGEIEEAVKVLRNAGCSDFLLLKCTSSYPAPFDEVNLETIPHLSDAFNVPVGLSDHTEGIAIPVAATGFNICMIEKHFTISREIETPDSSFSLEPDEFENLVRNVKQAEKAIGDVSYEVTQNEVSSRELRPSLYVVEKIEKGEKFTRDNVRSIRPAEGLHPRHLPDVCCREASQTIEAGTPLDWFMVR